MFLDEQNLLGASNDEIATGVQRTLVHLGHFHFVLAIQVTLAAPQHDGYSSDDQVVSDDPLVAASVLDVDDDFRRIRQIPQPTLE